jgi:hypothetical protein
VTADGLIELDQSCWTALAKYNLALATVFGALALGARTFAPEQTLLAAENGAFALLFGAVQTYAWLNN